jgi:hypothetical protein
MGGVCRRAKPSTRSELVPGEKVKDGRNSLGGFLFFEIHTRKSRGGGDTCSAGPVIESLPGGWVQTFRLLAWHPSREVPDDELHPVMDAQPGVHGPEVIPDRAF